MAKFWCILWLAVVATGCMNETQRREQLLEQLTSPDADLRREGAAMLGEEPSASWEATPGLLRMMVLGDMNEQVRATALQMLVQMKQAEVLGPLLPQAARDRSALVRCQCIAGAGLVTDEVAIEVLTRLLREDRDADIRRQAAEALLGYRQQAAISALLDALNDEEFSVSYTARHALAELVGRDLGDDEQEWRRWLYAGEDPLAAPGP